ncbi:STAS domain-containing protein [Sorangium sp. So ce1389]|uniref:STAS domain-containing protein n=1 Tax=Sorangium sp. So ce1389 TaxID=3133336 RepID=UPI003F644FFD
MESTEGQRENSDRALVEELKRENEALRLRVAELEVPARRYRSLFDAGIVSFQILDPQSRTVEVSPGFERIWRLRVEDLTGYLLLEDEQIVANGFMDQLERAFHTGEPVQLPTIRYDPAATDKIQCGTFRWVAAALHPVTGAEGEICEVVMLHMDVGELKQSEEELRRHSDQLAAAVAERTAELTQKLRLIDEQQHAIAELSTPVLRLWEGVLALPLIGRIDGDRAARMLDTLLRAIADTSAEQVLLDVTGVPDMDQDAASHLSAAARAAALLGARCVIVGLSARAARTLVELGLDFEGVARFANLQEGLRDALARRRRSEPGVAPRPAR